MKYVNIRPSGGFLQYLKLILGKVARRSVFLCLVLSAAVYYFNPFGGGSIEGGLRSVFVRCVHSMERGLRFFTGSSHRYNEEYCVERFLKGGILPSPYASDIKSISEENTSLRKMLNFITDYSNLSYVTTRAIISYDGVKTRVLLPIGHLDGVTEGQALVSSEGLVGRLVDVDGHRSGVVLITQKGFNVPVTILGSGKRFTLSGVGGGAILKEDVNVPEGSIVITVGDGKEFPHGIYVGYLGKGGKVVTTASQVRGLEVVSAVKIRD